MNKKGKKGISGGPGRLGRSLIKDRNKSNRRGKDDGTGWLHSCELEDGYDWGRLNLQSVTEQSRLDEFLSTAELAGVEFKAEKLNIKLVDNSTYTGLPTKQERAEARKAEKENFQYLSIPRRPQWDSSTSPEQLVLLERESFLEWRRSLIRLEEDDRLTLTPFERNLGFWRQLWRVVERSDILVQIVDARNPLLFRCEDLEKYVLEMSPHKVNMILISKADLLTSEQRLAWKEYFSEHTSIVIAFWSALLESEEEEGEGSAAEIEEEGLADESEGEGSAVEMEGEGLADRLDGEEGVESAGRQEGEESAADMEGMESSSHSELTSGAVSEDSGGCSEDPEDVNTPEEHPLDEVAKQPVVSTSPNVSASPNVSTSSNVFASPDVSTSPNVSTSSNVSRTSPDASSTMTPTVGNTAVQTTPTDQGEDNSDLLSRDELVALFRKISPVSTGSLTTVGMVGYPNVGKSSTINALFQGKKVPVSATPGRTKHFQTLYLCEDVMLCDCPGLVFPSFLSSKAEMVCSGILPIDQLRDHIPPTSLVCERIPRHVLGRTYGIEIPPPGEGEDQERPPYAHEVLSAYGCMRGYMTSHGQPDEPRSARYILKDYVYGKLLYCHPPPGVDGQQFNHQHSPMVTMQGTITQRVGMEQPSLCEGSTRLPRLGKFDTTYFQQERTQAVTKAVVSSQHSTTVQEGEGKPWKKHNNRNKKEKIRRTVLNS